MPHVVSQMSSGEFARTNLVNRQSVSKSVAMPKISVEFQQPPTVLPYRPRKSSNSEAVPRLSLLMPESQYRDFGSVRHIQQPSSSSDSFTPYSSADSVFDLPSGTSSFETPISSVNSPFAAELEDTSITSTQNSLGPKCQPANEAYITELKSPQFSKLAAIAIGNIKAIERDNRILLERAIAAEEATKLLKDQNQSLQHRIDYCKHQHRPKTAPGKSPRAVSAPTPVSTFNTTTKVEQTLYSTNVPAPPPCLRPLPIPNRTPYLSPSPSFDGISNRVNMANQGSNVNMDGYAALERCPKTPQTPTPTGKRRPRPSPLALSQPLSSPVLPRGVSPSPFATIPFPAKPHPYRRTRPNENMTLSQARMREKPLPPNGPMSPSTIPGRVEIGCQLEEWERGKRVDGKKKKGIRILFKLGKKGQSY